MNVTMFSYKIGGISPTIKSVTADRGGMVIDQHSPVGTTHESMVIPFSEVDALIGALTHVRDVAASLSPPSAPLAAADAGVETDRPIVAIIDGDGDRWDRDGGDMYRHAQLSPCSMEAVREAWRIRKLIREGDEG